MARAAKAAGLQHVIWSTFEDTRDSGPARRRPHADAAGQVQGSALRREGRCEPLLHGRGRARRRSCTRRSTGRTSSTSAWARSAAKTACWLSRSRSATRRCPSIAAEDIGKFAYGIFKARRRVHRQDRRHRRRAPDRRASSPPRFDGALGEEVSVQRRCRPTCSAASASRARTTSGTCSSSSATSRTTTAGPRPRARAEAQPVRAELRGMAGRNKDRIPIG